MLPNPGNEEYGDAVNGSFFDPKITKEARRTEVDWMNRVYSHAPRSVLTEKGRQIDTAGLSGHTRETG